MDKDQKREAIDHIMYLEYHHYEPWCKVKHLEDFDETNFTGSLADKSRRKYHQDNIDTVHHYIKDPGNAGYRKAFMDYFLYQLFVYYTPESMDTEELEEQEWRVVDQQERDERFDHIMKRSLDSLSNSLLCKYNDSYSQGDDRIKFIRLKDRFLEVFEEDALFLINMDPDDDMPAVIGMDKETIGIYFYTY